MIRPIRPTWLHAGLSTHAQEHHGAGAEFGPLSSTEGKSKGILHNYVLPHKGVMVRVAHTFLFSFIFYISEHYSSPAPNFVSSKHGL